MSKLQAVLTGTVPPGVYRFTSRAGVDTLMEEATAAGWRLFYLDGNAIEDKAGLMVASQAAFEFPGYVARNWDALEEAINDLAWAPAAGYVVLIDDVAAFAAHDPDTWSTALDILSTSAANWAQSATPMYVLLRQAGRSAPEVPVL